jgi:hypothetical protein
MLEINNKINKQWKRKLIDLPWHRLAIIYSVRAVGWILDVQHIQFYRSKHLCRNDNMNSSEASNANVHELNVRKMTTQCKTGGLYLRDFSFSRRWRFMSQRYIVSQPRRPHLVAFIWHIWGFHGGEDAGHKATRRHNLENLDLWPVFDRFEVFMAVKFHVTTLHYL